MAVSVVPGSVLINVFEHPKVELPEAPLRGIKPFGPFAPAPVMAGFGCTQISMGGEVKLTGDEDEIAGCTLGFVQMQFVETFWCHYRGKTNTDGSMLIQRGLAPARQQQTCRDCLDKKRSNIFLNVDELGRLDGPARPPVKLATGMEDSPMPRRCSASSIASLMPLTCCTKRSLNGISAQSSRSRHPMEDFAIWQPLLESALAGHIQAQRFRQALHRKLERQTRQGGNGLGRQQDYLGNAERPALCKAHDRVDRADLQRPHQGRRQGCRQFLARRHK